MSEIEIKKGPGLSKAQKIGDVARSALHANKPNQWILGESPGDDFGYDFQVTAFDPEGEGAQCAFNIQLKGTTQAGARLEGGTVLSYPFDRSTLNLWHRSGFAVLVVIVDLIDTLDPKLASVHYHFANYDLDDILPSLPSHQKTVRLHVPKDQVVHIDLDILPTVLPYLDELADARLMAKELNRARRTSAPESISIGSTDANSRAPISPAVFGDEIEALINTSVKKIELHVILTALRNGDFEKVISSCPAPDETACSNSPLDSAIVAHLRSMALDAIGDNEGADALIALALSLCPDADPIIGAAAQKRLDEIEFGDDGRSERDELFESIKLRNGLSAVSVKSKILALNRDFDEARKVLDSFPTEQVVITQIIVSTVERAWARVLLEVSSARELTLLRPRQRLLLDILESRAHFELALKDVPRPVNGEFIIPSKGLPNIDFDMLRLAYNSSRQAMQNAQRLNWPVDIKHILDVFPLSAMILGKAENAMPLMIALGVARANVTSIREIVAKMAIQLDRPEIVLELSDRSENSPKFEQEESVIAVAALKGGQIEKALGFVTEDMLADPSSTEVYLTSLLMLGIAASSVLRKDLLEKIKTRLTHTPEARHYEAILSAAIQVQQNLLQRTVAITNLFQYWTENSKPPVIGYHLLTNADPQDKVEAELFVEVAETLEVEHSLGNEEIADYGQALITLGRTNEAVKKLRSARIRYIDDPKIKSVLGVALELDGNSSEAFELFEQLLNEGKVSDTARRYYVEIAARIGYFDRAEEQVRTAYSKASSRERKLNLLNTLFQLLIAEGKRPTDIEEVAWEYGRLVNQLDEREEGIFLGEYLMATANENLEVNAARIDEFRQRLDSYTNRFPKSKFLWSAHIAGGSPPDAMMAALQEAVGLTDKDIEQAKAIERKMDRGLLEVPFSWRPRRYLRNVTNIFMLWEIRKGAPIEQAALHFRSSISGFDRNTPSSLNSKKIVLSLTSILLLDELELLKFVLNSTQHVVVARATLIALQEARSSFTGGWGREKASRIIEILQKFFSKISHPPYNDEEARAGSPNWYQEEKNAMKEEDVVYFSDDIVETYLVCSNDENELVKNSISTIDFLTWADKSEGLISPSKVADAIGQMTRLKVLAVTVEHRYFIAAIPDALNDATNKKEAEAVLQESLTLTSILRGVWHHYKPFKELDQHFSFNMSYLLNKGGANEEVLVALWSHWLATVRFQSEPQVTPIQKMLFAFIHILTLIDADKFIVSRLWRSFWTAIQRGFEHELHIPEDRVAIEEVGRFLGSQRANEDNEASAIALFEKAKLGLEAGTERESWFNIEYVDAMAKREIAKQKER